VASREGLNARDLTPDDLGEAPNALVADVSFVSLRLALPPALRLATPGAWGVFLVKPQFEVGRDLVGKGGIVRDAAAAAGAADGIAAWLEAEMGWSVAGLLPSPIAGGDGNREFLLGARRG
jgi:23S rRNA (cytidine1920-2'-O)/16S rRNA (cytidine1409-2'-O)-methyltransferase